MKLTIITTYLIASTLILIGEAVRMNNKVKKHTHTYSKLKVSSLDEIKSNEVDCSTDADCVFHGGSCGMTQLEWKNDDK